MEDRGVLADLRARLRDQDILLREMHHRIKNNLQIVAQLLYLRAASVGDPRLAALVREGCERIKAVALLHETLSVGSHTDRIHGQDYFERLASSLSPVVASEGLAVVDITVSTDSNAGLSFDSALACGLIVTELVTNAVKHAFPERRTGRVEIRLDRDAPGTACLSVQDDGVGFEEDAIENPSNSLGLQIVRMLAQQLGSRLEFDRNPGKTLGTRFRIPSVSLLPLDGNSEESAAG